MMTTQVAYAMDIAHSVAEALKSDHTSVKPLLSALGNPASESLLAHLDLTRKSLHPRHSGAVSWCVVHGCMV